MKAGTVVAQSHRWNAISRDAEIMSITNTWFVNRDVPDWDLDDHWVVNMEGRPNLTIDTRGSTSLEKAPLSTFADTESGPMDTVTAMTCVNAIPRVCAAVAGIVYPDTTNLPAVLWAHQQT